jgi:hypothetical protein
MDVKAPQAVHSEAVSNSDIDDTEKAGRSSIAGRNSIAGAHKENLEDLEDPDAGKSAEERAAIVRFATYLCELKHED